MKFTVTIILSLIQFGLLGQPSEWNKNIIKKNRVKEVQIYTKVPKTNPDYFIEPKGLMLISETTFDEEGREIQTNCKNCHTETHREGDCCADVIQNFFYNKGKLIRIEEMDFHKSTSLFYYDSIGKRKLIIDLDRDDQRNGTTLEYFDNQGREVSTITIDFDNIWIKGDTVCQVFISKTISTYDKLTKTRVEFGRAFGSNIEKSIFDIFKNSVDFNEIEKAFQSIDLTYLELRTKVIFHYDEKGTEIKIVDGKDEASHTTYFLSKNGLIKNEEDRMTKYTFEYEYHYRFRN